MEISRFELFEQQHRTIDHGPSGTNASGSAALLPGPRPAPNAKPRQTPKLT